jgi:hypothetical protein
MAKRQLPREGLLELWQVYQIVGETIVFICLKKRRPRRLWVYYANSDCADIVPHVQLISLVYPLN